MRVADSHPDPIDLLVTDIVLPDRRGPELHTALARQRPGLAVLFMSGYAGGAPPGSAEEIAPERFLRKPFHVEGLSEAVARTLAAR